MVHVNTGALTELFSCGKSGAPVIVPLSSGELLLSKENVGIFIGADGKPSRKVPYSLHLRAHLELYCKHCMTRLGWQCAISILISPHYYPGALAGSCHSAFD